MMLAWCERSQDATRATQNYSIFSIIIALTGQASGKLFYLFVDVLSENAYRHIFSILA